MPSQFCWIADSDFNGIRHIFIQIFVQVNLYVDNTICLCSEVGLNFTVLELEYKKLICIAFIGREQTIEKRIEEITVIKL